MLALCAVATLILGAPEAFARGTLDQTAPAAVTDVSGLGIDPFDDVAQTFTAGRTGFLDTVALALFPLNADGRYTIQVVPTDASGVPAGAPLASRTIDACRLDGISPLEIPFGPAASITGGTRYAIVAAYQADSVAPNNPTPPGISWVGASPYTNGAAFSGLAPTPMWATTEFGDVGFSTYVSTTAPPALNRDGTQTTVTSATNPAPPGPVTFTASVRDPSHPARVATGTVAFRVDNNDFRFFQPLDAQGRASQTIDNLPTRTSTITAAYCPDTDGFESSAGTVDEKIVQDATETNVVAEPQAIRVGDSTRLTATVKDIDTSARPPPAPSSSPTTATSRLAAPSRCSPARRP